MTITNNKPLKMKNKIPFRTKLLLTCNTTLVPFNNQACIIGAIHKWIGKNNNKHGMSGEWNVSMLSGGIRCGNGLTFNDGFIIISGTDKEFRDMVVRGIVKDPTINWGMKVKSIELIDEYENHRSFFCVSPLLFRKQLSNRKHYFTFNDEDVNEFMTNRMKRVLTKVLPNVPLGNFSIRIGNREKDKLSRKIKDIILHDKSNRSFLTNIIINGDRRAVDFCYYNGIGDSTGCGFGMLGVNCENYFQ